MSERSRRIGIRLNSDERKFIWEQAAASRLSASEFIRRRILGRQIVPKSDLVTLGELRRLGGLLKHIHLETRGIYSGDTRSAIQALEGCARELTKHIRQEGIQADHTDHTDHTDQTDSAEQIQNTKDGGKNSDE